ncbi:hypothetical protein [Marmoricola sp. RAF53]|uniref:hypothetical protein n=1 Tax=Marmoricola sp. RAF53 TaxID=3233059 RepID=UPI003F95DF91
MDEDIYWERFRETLLQQPLTGDDPCVLFELLNTAGYYRPRTGFPRPSWLNPERAAMAAWRLTFAAPEHAREVARTYVRAPGPTPQIRPAVAQVLTREAPAAWWAESPHADFWFEFEKEFAQRYKSGPSNALALIRGDTGRRFLCRLRWARRETCWVDPQALAAEAIRCT